MSERRKHPRINLAAQVEVSSSDVIHLLRAENASLGGLFLQGNPENYPQFQPGAELALHICEVEPAGADDEEGIDVRAQARIIRIQAAADDDQGGFALEFVSLDSENEGRLRQLLDRGSGEAD